MPFSPKAPTVLCVFVVKNPLSVAALHRSCTARARLSTTTRSNVIHLMSPCKAPISGIFCPPRLFHLYGMPAHG
jgi:hypothetical protein